MKRPIPFGKYYLLERINVGGMAEVFKAKTYGVEGFERLLAVKRILPNIAEDEEFITMFIDEAKIAVQLNHANIAQIFDLGKVDDSHFIALEYIHGKDLRAIFDRCRSLSEPMPIPQACFIIMKVCEGLDYAHNKRDGSGREMHLVHRDVSPQNVLISYEGEVKLVDFGIAKAAGKASKTEAGILKGKFGYMSPEQVRGLPLDRRSDIFSVSIVLYELLTGERLFLGESDFSTLERVRNVEILPPSTYNRRITEDLEQIVLRGLSKDVEDRYQHAIDLHDDLQAYMYASGDFYSRKDLASWMKRTFAREIEEEDRKLEEYRHLAPPNPSQPSVSVPRVSTLPGMAGGQRGPGTGANGQVRPPPLPMGENSPVTPLVGDSLDDAMLMAQPTHEEPAPALSWDDEEVETQIYDKPGLLSAEFGEHKPQDAVPTAETPAEEMIDENTGPEEWAPQQTGAGPAPEEARLDFLPDAIPPYSPAGPSVAVRRSHLGVWLFLAGLAVMACGGVLYYFLVTGAEPGSISITATPRDVKIFLDTREQGAGTPFVIRELKPGPYNVLLERQGYSDWKQTVQVKASEQISLSPRLQPAASIELRTTPSGAEAFLDGQRLKDVTPVQINKVVPGKHRLEVRRPQFRPWIHEFEVQAKQVLPIEGKLSPSEVEVQVESTPEGEVFLLHDGKRESLGKAPARLRLDPGLSYRVEIVRQGYQTWSEALTLTGTSMKRVKAELKPEVASHPSPGSRVRPTPKAGRKRNPVRQPRPPAVEPDHTAPAGTGTLLVNTNPWTRIYVDGRDTGLTTPTREPISLSAGEHSVTLRNEKFKIDKTFRVEIKPNRPSKLIKKEKDLKPAGS